MTNYKTSDFDYQLPKEFIAHTPVTPRDNSKLLIYDTSKDIIYHKRFTDIINYLDIDHVLIRNNSKVRSARILFGNSNKPKEIFILKNTNSNEYQVLVKPGKFFTIGKSINLTPDLSFTIKDILPDGSRLIHFNNNTGQNLDKLLEELGDIPLPPYISNKNLKFSSYQTVYAQFSGSVAAPTAGLHFTHNLCDKLIKKGVNIEDLTLHVGRGTFLPVTSDTITNHKMHKETFLLDNKTSQRLNKHKLTGKKFVAVGTTSVRTLESSFDTESSMFIPQCSETDIFIYPGSYKWKVVDKLITNFHLPKSTLIMLVASLLEHKGVDQPVKKILELYEIAKKNNYRFYSLGDAMFII